MSTSVKTILIITVVGLAFFAGSYFGQHKNMPMDTMNHDVAEQSSLWTCGMHPEVLMDEPGQCPICGMDLTEIREDSHDHDVAEQTSLWSCGMHPEVIMEEPGQCPICGMDLTPIRDEDPSMAGSGERTILFYRSPMDPTVTSPEPRQDEMGMEYVPVYADEGETDGTPEGQGVTVSIPGEVMQRMNVKTQPVIRQDVSRRIRTVGYLDYDQERMVTVTTKYNGFVEKTFVNYVGQPVRKGEPLLEIYSPELVQTEQELLSALAYSKRLAEAPKDTRRRAEALVEAARSRLAYWDISKEQIDRLEETGKVFRTLKVVSPSNGLIMQRMPSLDGMAVGPGMQLMMIADISNLWMSVEVFESQLAWVDVGSRADISLTYFPGESFSGKVRFVEPEVSEKTRTLRLTLEVPNRDGRLRSNMYATVIFEPVAAKDALTVPSMSVIRSGERNVVVVQIGPGRFAPREVTLGAEGDGIVQILEGLEDDEIIVTSSQFLIDSESSLREAIQKLIREKRSGGSNA